MDYKQSMMVIVPYVDSYCAWAKRYQPYDFFRGSKHPTLKTAMESVFKYFDNVRHAPTCYHCNDGRKSGGGFTGPMCDFGGMPCYMSFRFYDDSILISIYKEDTKDGSSQPGLRLLSVHVQVDGRVDEVGYFDNILK